MGNHYDPRDEEEKDVPAEHTALYRQYNKLYQGIVQHLMWLNGDKAGVQLVRTSRDVLVVQHVSLRNIDLSQACLTNIWFENCDLTGVMFDEAKLWLVSFKVCTLDHGLFSRIRKPFDVQHSMCKGPDGLPWDPKNVKAKPTYRSVLEAYPDLYSQLEDHKLYLAEAKGSRTAFGPMTIEDCDLRGLHLSEAIFHHCTFKRCDFTGAKFVDASMWEVCFEECVLDHWVMEEVYIAISVSLDQCKGPDGKSLQSGTAKTTVPRVSSVTVEGQTFYGPAAVVAHELTHHTFFSRQDALKAVNDVAPTLIATQSSVLYALLAKSHPVSYQYIKNNLRSGYYDSKQEALQEINSTRQTNEMTVDQRTDLRAMVLRGEATYGLPDLDDEEQDVEEAKAPEPEPSQVVQLIEAAGGYTAEDGTTFLNESAAVMINLRDSKYVDRTAANEDVELVWQDLTAHGKRAMTYSLICAYPLDYASLTKQVEQFSLPQADLLRNINRAAELTYPQREDLRMHLLSKINDTKAKSLADEMSIPEPNHEPFPPNEGLETMDKQGKDIANKLREVHYKTRASALRAVNRYNTPYAADRKKLLNRLDESYPRADGQKTYAERPVKKPYKKKVVETQVLDESTLRIKVTPPLQAMAEDKEDQLDSMNMFPLYAEDLPLFSNNKVFQTVYDTVLLTAYRTIRTMYKLETQVNRWRSR